MPTLFPHVPLALLGLAAGLSAQNIQASLTALQPLTLNQANVGTVTHPAGPLTSANLSLGTSSVTVNLAQTTLGHSLSTYLDCDFAQGANYYTASTDLELTLSASLPTRATLRIYTFCGDDGGGSVDIDVPGYGSITFYNGSSFGERHYDHFLVDLTTTGLPITITQASGGFQAGRSLVSLAIEEWSPLASPTASGCGGLFYTGNPSYPVYQGDHFLDLVDNANPTISGTLRADAFGQFSSYVLSFQPTQAPLQLPAPFSASCPILSNAPVLVAGFETDNFGLPTAWEVDLPVLPAGLTFYAQHACAKVTTTAIPGNTLWNTSNVVRIDT